MSKQILILNGSPRIHGNTAALIDAFTAGAEAAGHTVARFDLAALDIHGCRGCLGGGRDPRHPCVQRDGMDAVYPAYMAADVVVLASPMYYWSISGQLRCAFDRLFAVAELGPDLANPVKDAVLLMAAEGDTEENFAPVRAYYKALLDCLAGRMRALYTPAGTWPSGISRPIRSSWRPPGNWARRCDRPAVVLTRTRTGAGASLCFRVRGDIMQPSKPNAVGNHDAARRFCFHD